MLTTKGFTLLELMVVMLVMALIAGAVAPSIHRSLEGAERRGLVADIEARLSSLPIEAFERGEALKADQDFLMLRLPPIPSYGRIVVITPPEYASNGMSSGGRIRLVIAEKDNVDFWIQPVTGKVTREMASDQ